MADHSQKPAQRPLSPFVTIWRWPLTMATSFIHKATGIGLVGGMMIVAWWLMAVAYGPDSYHFFTMIVGSLIGQALLFCFVLSGVYHSLNGIRHLAWDFGYGFAIQTANRTGILVFALTVILTVAFFVLAYAGMGGYYQ